MKKADRVKNIKNGSMIHESRNDDSQVIEDFRTFFVVLFVFAIYVV